MKKVKKLTNKTILNIFCLSFTISFLATINTSFAIGDDSPSAAYKPIHGGYPDPIFTADIVDTDLISTITSLAHKLGTSPDDLYPMLKYNGKNGDKSFLLKPLQVSDQEIYCKIFAYENTSENLKYMCYYTNGKPKAKSDAEALFKTRFDRMQEYKPMGLYFLIDQLDGTISTIAGQIAIGAFISTEAPEVAYIVFKEYAGNKFATNALLMVVKIVEKYYPEISIIKATTHPDNIASKTVLEHAGFLSNGRKDNSFGPRLEYIFKTHTENKT